MADDDEQYEAKVVFVIPFDAHLDKKYKIGQEVPVGEFNLKYRNLKLPKVHGDKLYFYLRFNNGYVLRKSIKYYEVVEDPLKDNTYPVMWLYNLLDAKVYTRLEAFLAQEDHSSPYRLFKILKGNTFNYSVNIELREGDYVALQRNFTKPVLERHTGKFKGAGEIYDISLQIENGKVEKVKVDYVIPQLGSTNKLEFAERTSQIYRYVFPLVSNVKLDNVGKKYNKLSDTEFAKHFDVFLPELYPKEPLIMIISGKDKVYFSRINEDGKVSVEYQELVQVDIPIWSFDTYGLNDEALLDDLEANRLTVKDLNEALGVTRGTGGTGGVGFQSGHYIMLMDYDGYMFYGTFRDDMSIEYLENFNPQIVFTGVTNVIHNTNTTSTTSNIDRSIAPGIDIAAPSNSLIRSASPPRRSRERGVKFAEGTKPGSRSPVKKPPPVIYDNAGDNTGDNKIVYTKMDNVLPVTQHVERASREGPLTKRQIEQVIKSLRFDDDLNFDGIRLFSLRGSYIDGRKRKTLIIPYAHRYNNIDDDLFLEPNEVEDEKRDAIEALESSEYDLLDKNEFYYEKPLGYIKYLDY